jgi:hypothetical protein
LNFRAPSTLMVASRKASRPEFLTNADSMAVLPFDRIASL